MTKRNPDERLERFNVVLGTEDIAWLDQLATEIQTTTGAKPSRSEIIRAAVATLKELHRCAPRCPTKLMPLAQCKNGAGLVVAGILAVRRAATL